MPPASQPPTPPAAAAPSALYGADSGQASSPQQPDTETLYEDPYALSAGGGAGSGQAIPTAPVSAIPPPNTGAPRPRWFLPVIVVASLLVVTSAGAAVYAVVGPKPSPTAQRSTEAPPTTPPGSSESVPQESASPSQAEPSASPVLIDETFSGSTLPKGWTQADGTWKVKGGRLEASTKEARSRIQFLRDAPENYRVDVLVHFVKVANARRWINIGLDYHHSDDWGAVLVARSNTTVSDGMELAQRSRTGGRWISDPKKPATVPLGVGQDHWISVEVRGRRLQATIDGHPALTASNLKRTDGGLSFIINQGTVQFDNLKITRLDG